MKLFGKRLKQAVSNKTFKSWLVTKVAMPLLPFAALIAIWHLAAQNFHPDLLPSPLNVGRALWELGASGELAKHASTSIARVFVGFGLATLCAIPLGLLLGWYRRFGEIFSPIIEVFRTISPISWIPLSILWLGIGNTPAIFIIFLSCFFPILISTIHAVANIDPVLLRVAKNFGAKHSNLFRHVILPASFPYIILSLRISLGISWIVIVAAEMVGLRSGLGYLIMDARNFLRTDFVIAGMVTIGLIGFVLDRLMRFAERHFNKYKTRSETA